MPRARDSLRQQVADLQRQLREAQEELSAWHQEFTTTVNGKPYVMDALEAGKRVQDAEAEARMALQGAAEQRALAERLFDYVMVQEGGFKDITLANEAAALLGAPAEAQEEGDGG